MNLGAYALIKTILLSMLNLFKKFNCQLSIKLIPECRIIPLLLLIIFACGKSPNMPDYQKEVAVFGFLWGNKPMTADQAIMVAYTQPIDKTYEFSQAAIQDANVTITDITAGKVYILRETEQPGFYFNDSLIPQPKMEYVLSIEVDDKIVTATTTVPQVLGIQTNLGRDTVDSVYHDDLSKNNPIFIECEDAEQIIVVDMYCNESWENAEYLSPFWGQEKPGEAGEYGGNDGNSEPRHIIASAKFRDLLSFADYTGKHVIDWYSSMIVFFGSNTMQVMAIDDNYYNFININEYPESQSGVNGGIGVFGSAYGETFRLYVLKP